MTDQPGLHIDLLPLAVDSLLYRTFRLVLDDGTVYHVDLSLVPATELHETAKRLMETRNHEWSAA